ncbi:MAG: alpha/beta fold hydrolase [Dehalococcoidia bacterium]
MTANQTREIRTPRFTRGPVRIAYDVHGHGEQTLVVIPGFVSHLDYDWETPAIRGLYQRLGSDRRLIRFDRRGTGLSDRPSDPEAYSPEVQIDDVTAVLDAAGVRRAVVFAWSISSPIAIAFAARYPERVSHLVLYGSFARLFPGLGYPAGVDPTLFTALLDIVRVEWGLGSRALADAFIPEADLEQLAWFAAYQRVGTSPQAMVAFATAAGQADLRPLLPLVTMPVLVLHRREDPIVPFALGEYLAGNLPQATLRDFPGPHHLPYLGETQPLTDAVTSFLRASSGEGLAHTLSPRELEVLRLLAEGLQNRDIASRLGVSPATVRRHLANTFIKLDVSTRAGAAAFAFRHGLV